MFVILAVAAETAAGQTIHRLDLVKSQPLIERNEDGYAGCGIRIIAADADAHLLHDFSLRLAWKFSSGLLDASTSKIAQKKAKAGEAASRLITPAPSRFWIVKETEAKALRPERIGREDVPGTLLAALPLMPTFQAIADIMQGERMQFSIGQRNVHKDLDRALSFKAPLSKEDSTSLAACLLAMLKSIEEEVNQAKAPQRK